MISSYEFKLNGCCEDILLPELYEGNNLNFDFWRKLNDMFVKEINIYVDVDVYEIMDDCETYSQLQELAPQIYDFLSEVMERCPSKFFKIKFSCWYFGAIVDELYPRYKFNQKLTA